MKNITINDKFGLLVNFASLVGLILQCFDLKGIIPMVAGVFICGGIIFNIIVCILDYKRSKVSYGKSQMTIRGKKLIEFTQNKVVLFGGDLSWTEKYLNSIKKVIKNGKEVIVFYPEEKKDSASKNVTTLEQAGVKVVQTSYDIGLRAILIDPDNEDDKEGIIVFLTNKVLIKKNMNKKDIAAYEYRSEIFYYNTDKVVVNMVVKIYKLATSNYPHIE